ncbi:MAG TPA: hypothetical protein VF729_08860, partial [Solirubrobacterales bacterium]
MARSGSTAPWLAGTIFIVAVAFAACLACSAGTAAAATGGAPTPGGSPPPPGSPSGAPADGASAGTLSLVSATTTPRKSFYYGVRYPRLSYTIASTQAQNDLRIDVVDVAGESVRTFFR